MADSREVPEYRSTDPVAAANSADRDEPLATEEEKDEVYDDEDERRQAGFAEAKSAAEARPVVAIGETLTSYATSASGASATTASHVELQKKPWYKNPNPLKWGKVPPVPKERIVSREYNAGFFSRLIFQWMAPVMSVSTPLSPI
jgi:hypothetical protein